MLQVSNTVFPRFYALATGVSYRIWGKLMRIVLKKHRPVAAWCFDSELVSGLISCIVLPYRESILKVRRGKLIGLVFAFFCGIASSMVWAGCADLSNSTNWSDIDTHRIVMYQKNKAIAVLEIPYCTVLKSSDIRLIKDTVCNWDKIVVSGEVCDVRKVEKL